MKRTSGVFDAFLVFCVALLLNVFLAYALSAFIPLAEGCSFKTPMASVWPSVPTKVERFVERAAENASINCGGAHVSACSTSGKSKIFFDLTVLNSSSFSVLRSTVVLILFLGFGCDAASASEKLDANKVSISHNNTVFHLRKDVSIFFFVLFICVTKTFLEN